MFAIYDIQGLRFRNTLEHLHKIKPTPASQKTTLRSDDANQALKNLAEEAAERKPDNPPLSLKAQQAYREILHLTEREAILHAHQLMSQPVMSVQSTLDIASAWNIFRNQPFHQLPVLDIRQRIVGMLSERDLLHFLISDEYKLRHVLGQTVADAMSNDVITADPVTDVRRIAKVMLTYHLCAIPIVDERDTLIGLVSRSDILRSVTNDPPLSLWS